MRARGFIHGLGIFLRGKKPVCKQLIENYECAKKNAKQLIENYECAKKNAVSRQTGKEVEIAGIQAQIQAYKERKALLTEQMAGLQEQYDQADSDEKKMAKLLGQLEIELSDIKCAVEEEAGMIDMLNEIETTSTEKDGMLSLVNLSKEELHLTVGVSIIAHLMYMSTQHLREFAEALVTGGINYRSYVMDNGYTLDRFELMTDVAYALELVATVTDEADAMQQEIASSIAGQKRNIDDDDNKDDNEDDDDDDDKQDSKRLRHTGETAKNG